jgi:hypothetical protein
MLKTLRIMAKGIWLLVFFPDEFDMFEEQVVRIRYRMNQLRKERDDLHQQMRIETDPELIKPLRARLSSIKREGQRAWKQL